MARLVLILVLGAVLAASAGAAPAPVRLLLPYDMEAAGSSVYIADGLRHQILRLDLRTRRISVYAGTGQTGTSGDGGPARKARLTEPVEIARDGRGNLYFSDVNQARVRRIDARGVITTVARVRAPAGISVDPTGRYLAVSSIEGSIYRLTLPTGPLETLATGLNGPHDVTYDADGNLYLGSYGNVKRINAATGQIEEAVPHPGYKVIVAPDRSLYLMTGDPNGGKITHVDETGKVLDVIGTGKLGPHRATVPISRVAFLPTDVEPVAGGVLISQAQPIAAIRRLANGSSTLTTLVR